MSILTTPTFYYIDQVTVNNQLLNFKEPNISSAELTATIAPGGYSMDELGPAIASALNSAGQQTYNVTLDRTTRLYTITSSDVCELLVTTGSNSGASIFSTVGFTSDKTGSSSYQGDVAAGTQYTPQFSLQGFVGFDDQVESILPSINESASGDVEILTYGTRQFMNFNIRYVTDNPQGKGSPITNNPNAVQELRDFLSFGIAKGNLEFMADNTNLLVFDKILLESTASSRTGTGYRLVELYNENLLGYFETGTLRFRKV